MTFFYIVFYYIIIFILFLLLYWFVHFVTSFLPCISFYPVNFVSTIFKQIM